MQVYGPAKTVADCFKFRNKVGMDVAMEALRECWRGKKATMDELWQYIKDLPGGQGDAPLSGGHRMSKAVRSTWPLRSTADWSITPRRRIRNRNGVLMRYGLERLAYRLSQSEHRGKFVMKGAMLFLVWTGEPYRATKDLDMLALRTTSAVRWRASSSPSALRKSWMTA